MATTESAQTEPAGKGLKAGSLGLLGGIVMGIASTAPAYSLAASLGYVVITENGGGIVGVKAPLIMVVAFVPMYFIAVAYSELNKAEPDCGTTFTWAARAFGTRTGWLGGWGIIIADIIVMANLAQIAGSYSYSLFGFDDLAASTFWSTVAGHRLDRRDDLHLLPRHRGLGPPAVRTARRRGAHPHRVRALRPREGLQRQRPGRRPQAEPLLAVALGPVVDVDRHRHPHRGVHLLGLGHGGRHQRGVRRPRPGRPAAPPSSRRCSCC